jgi:hypothetical protein
MADGNAKVFARVDPAFRERIKRDADERFGGNESMTVRAALDLYLDLRETHGPRYELIVLDLRNADTKEQVAA